MPFLCFLWEGSASPPEGAEQPHALSSCLFILHCRRILVDCRASLFQRKVSCVCAYFLPSRPQGISPRGVVENETIIPPAFQCARFHQNSRAPKTENLTVTAVVVYEKIYRRCHGRTWVLCVHNNRPSVTPARLRNSSTYATSDLATRAHTIWLLC